MTVPTLHVVTPDDHRWRCADCGAALKRRSIFCSPCYAKRKDHMEALAEREKVNPRPMEEDPPLLFSHCQGCQRPLDADYVEHCGAYCLDCLAKIEGVGQDAGGADYSRAVCLDDWCPWFRESRGDDESLKFGAEMHARDTGHRVGYWWHTDILRDMGDEPDEVIG